MIDTHCHLDFPVFDLDRQEILQRANGIGFEAIVIPAVVQKDWERVMELCHTDNLVPLRCALGLHPCFVSQHASVQDAKAALTDKLNRLDRGCSVVAVGEIGLDYFSSSDTKQRQLELFDMQLQVAKTSQLPVLLHVRKAHDDVLKRLRKLQLPKGGIVHAFSGSEQQAQQYCQLGFVLGIGGTATYDRAKKLARIIRQVPIESLVLETDAPDIPPSFTRGERNSPLNLPRIAEHVAAIRDVSVDELIRQTTINANRILGLQG